MKNKELNSGPSSPELLQGWKTPWGRGGASAPPSSGSGENPHLLSTPPPPTPELLVLELEGNEECGKYFKAAAGAGWLPSHSQRPHRNAAASAIRGPGLQGPPGPGRERHPEPAELGRGDHGFRLHSGQSFPGTPEPPGSRTGTRPVGRAGMGCGCFALTPVGSPRPPWQPGSAAWGVSVAQTLHPKCPVLSLPTGCTQRGGCPVVPCTRSPRPGVGDTNSVSSETAEGGPCSEAIVNAMVAKTRPASGGA